MSDGVRIEFSDLAKRYDRRVIFRGVGGSAEPGRVLLIAGPNGSGKSTLVSLLCGLVRPSRGRIRYVDDDGTIPRTQWRLRLGIAAPRMAVYEELTARENLGFFSRVRGIERSTADLDARIEAVGLDPKRRSPVGDYSTGMRQRLMIAQALLHDPEVLFFDEPGSNLDPAGRDWLDRLISDLAGAGRTVVVATNDLREMAWGDVRVDLGA